MAALPNVKAALEPQPDIARGFFTDLNCNIHLVAIYEGQKDPPGKSFGRDIESAVNWAVLHNDARANVYWTVNEVVEGRQAKPKKEHITHARFAYLDIDPKKDGTPFVIDDHLAALRELRLQPSFVIFSGGGIQAFWRLDEPDTNRDKAEAINRGIKHMFGGDSVHNIDRLMRVPGLINWPTEKKRQAGRTPALATIIEPDDGQVYFIGDLEAAFPAPLEERKTVVQVEVDADFTLHTPSSIGASPYLTTMIHGPMPPRYGNDRSRWGNGVAWSLARAGKTDAEIMGVLLNPENACSAHYLEQADPQRAAVNSIKSARKTYPSPRVLGPPAECEDEQADPEVDEEALPIAEPNWYRNLGDDAFAEYIHTVLDSARAKQPELSLASALAVFGTLAGRRYEGPGGEKTNFFIVGLAESSTGKDWPLKACGKLLAACDRSYLSGANKIGSESGMLAALTRNPTQLFAIDEAHSLLHGILDKKGAKHMRDIATRLTELYSCTGSTFNGTDLAAGRTEPIEHPHLCFYGTCPKSTLFDGKISPDEFGGGMLPRFLFFQGENKPVCKFDSDGSIKFSRAVIQTGKSLNRLKAGLPDGNKIVPIYRRVARTPDAEAFAKAIWRESNDERDNVIERNPALGAIHGRQYNHAASIALLRAVVANPTNPIITLDMLQWADDIAERNTLFLSELLANHSSYGDHDACANAIKSALAKAGKFGLTRAQLNDKLRKYSDIREKVALELVASEVIFLKEKPPGPKGGAPGKVYVLAKYA